MTLCQYTVQTSLQLGPECLPEKSGPNFFGGDSATGGHTVASSLNTQPVRQSQNSAKCFKMQSHTIFN